MMNMQVRGGADGLQEEVDDLRKKLEESQETQGILQFQVNELLNCNAQMEKEIKNITNFLRARGIIPAQPSTPQQQVLSPG
jgi:peptidoglycan hydrolase CwlO-like protein